MKPEQVIGSIIKFAEAEMLPAMEGNRLWGAGFALGVIKSMTAEIPDAVLKHPALTALNVIDEKGDVNIRRINMLLEEAKKAAEKHGPLDINIRILETDIPIIGLVKLETGTFKLGKAAFERLGEYIRTAADM